MNNTKSAIEPRNSAKKKLKSSKNKLNSKKKSWFFKPIPNATLTKSFHLCAYCCYNLLQQFVCCILLLQFVCCNRLLQQIVLLQ